MDPAEPAAAHAPEEGLIEINILQYVFMCLHVQVITRVESGTGSGAGGGRVDSGTGSGAGGGRDSPDN